MSGSVIEPQAVSRLARFLTRTAAVVSTALSRFPISVLAIGLLTVMANMEVAGIRLIDERYDLRLVATLSAAAVTSILATLFAERLRLTSSFRILIGALAAVAAGLLAWFGWNGYFFAPPFLAACVLGLPMAPHILRSNPLRFWTFLLWTSFGVALGFLSVLIFVLGLSAIFEMVRYLFGIGLSGKAYQHTYATALTFVGPLFALGRIPRDFDEEADIDHTDRFIAGIAVLQNWVALPLVLAAAAILHLYVGKILLKGEVPKNQIGWIVGSYALFVLSLRIAAAPFVSGGGAAQRVFGRVWLPILIVPVALLSYAVWLRIDAEGFTAERYYLALAAFAAASILVAQAPTALRGDVRVMAAIPVTLLALSAFGSWGVAATVARSQMELIVRDFVAASPDGRIRSEGLDERQRGVLRSRVFTLAEVAALSRLDPLMSEDAHARAMDAGGAATDATVYIEALRIDYGARAPSYVEFRSARRTPFDVSGFDRVETGFVATDDSLAAEPESAAAIRNRQIVLHLRGVADRIDPAPIADRFRNGAHAEEAMQFDVKTVGGRSLRLRVTSYTALDGADYPTSVGFDVAFRATEWQPPPSLGGDGNR